jgi:hypothetical protein
VIIEIYGLRVAAFEDQGAAAPSADIRWIRRRVDRLEFRPSGSVRQVAHSDAMWTHHTFGKPTLTALEFAVSPDGRTVISDALPLVPDHDLVGLFSEAVMRTVLHRMGLVSFHGAVLALDGEAIMILGRKGAGKSTLAASLQAQGWILLADDLALVRRTGDGWRIPRGFCQLKLHEDAARNLGHDVGTMARRWRSEHCPVDPGQNKVVLESTDGGISDARLRAIYVLGRRGRGEADISQRMPSPGEKLALLVAHLSENPLHPAARPTRIEFETAGAMLRDVALLYLNLPDAMDRLDGIGPYFEGRSYARRSPALLRDGTSDPFRAEIECIRPRG